MKVVTVLGTRPEIIRLSRIIPVLDKLCNHTLIHTNQNYSTNLNSLFFRELKIRKPDVVYTQESNSTMSTVGNILIQTEKYLSKIKPDRFLVLGDTYSGLSAIVAKRMGIPVFHMEAGNRCYDDNVPEEVNRRIIDSCSDVLMPYSNRSKEILFSEGYKHNKVFVIGNPIGEVLNFYEKDINNSKIVNRLGLKTGKYFLMTLHRAETVDFVDKLKIVLNAVNRIQLKYKMPIILSLHPRTKDVMKKNKIKFNNKNIILLDAFGLFDFVNLEKNAFCTISDSGTIQEEGSIFKIPTVLLRESTERYETIEAGSNIITGINSENIVNGVEIATETELNWKTPEEYSKNNVSTTVARILLSNWQK